MAATILDQLGEVPFEELVIGREVGMGAYARVFKARHRALGRVAVKVLRPHHAAKGQELLLFLREALLLSQSNHRNIIKFHGICRIPQGCAQALRSDTDTWGMVLEYCEGGSLFSLVCDEMARQRLSGYSKLEALGWMLDLAHALQYLHQRDDIIIHRDIKMENVLLKRDKDTGCLVAKLADFGLHKAVELAESKVLRIRCGTSNNLSFDGRASVASRLSSRMPSRMQLDSGSANGDPSSPHDACDGDPRRCPSSNFLEIPDGAHEALVKVASKKSLMSRPSPRSFQHSDTPNVRMTLRLDSDGSLHIADACSPRASGAAVFRAVSSPQYTDADLRPARHGQGLCEHARTSCSGNMHLQLRRAATAANTTALACPRHGVPDSCSESLHLQQRQRASAMLREGLCRADSPAGSFCAKSEQQPLATVASLEQRSDSAQTIAASPLPSCQGSFVGEQQHRQQQQHRLLLLQRQVSKEGEAAVDIVAAATAHSAVGAESAADVAVVAVDRSGEQQTPTMVAFLEASRSQFHSNWHHVFSLTGHTGSMMYMAPEVFLQLPYNETADIFSFGVILYELLTRSLLRFTLGARESEPTMRTADDYAAAIARGFRPRRPHSMSHGMWDLIQQCWNEDPCARPNTCDLMSALEAELEVAQEEPAGPNCRCVIA